MLHTRHLAIHVANPLIQALQNLGDICIIIHIVYFTTSIF